MRLLLTRAPEDAERTRAKLQAAGHHVTAAPVITIVPARPTWPGGVVDAVLATSGHAFPTLASAPQPSAEARRLMPLMLVGRRTEEMARRHGFHGAALVAPDAARLAAEIGALTAKPRRLLYLAGHDRKPDLERELAAIDRPPTLVECYTARPVEALAAPAEAAIAAGAIEGILHFSRRSAELFIALTKKAGLDLGPARHFCLSDDVAAPLRDAGYTLVDTAEVPNETALLAMLPNRSQP